MGGVVVKEWCETAVSIRVFLVESHLLDLVFLLFGHIVESLHHIEMGLFIPLLKVLDVSESYRSKLFHHLFDDLLFRGIEVDGFKGNHICFFNYTLLALHLQGL